MSTPDPAIDPWTFPNRGGEISGEAGEELPGVWGLPAVTLRTGACVA